MLSRYSPVWLVVGRRGLSLRLGWIYKPFTAGAYIFVSWEFNRHEIPGVNVSIDLWRLHLGAGLGGGWQDEDAETRGFLYVRAQLSTYGWRYIGCWSGHQPEQHKWNPDATFCARCDTLLEYKA